MNSQVVFDGTRCYTFNEVSSSISFDLENV